METYTPSEVLAIITGIGVLVTALGATIVNIIVALRTGKKLDDSLTNQQTISNQVKEVHTITNSNLSAVKAELKQATMQIEEMKTFVRDLKSERDKLASNILNNRTVRKEDGTSAISLPSAPEVKDVLDAIEENTLNIDRNTKVLQTSIDKNTVETTKNTKEVKEKK